MNPSPRWIGSKLCCMCLTDSGPCRREMFIRSGYAVCENMTHGGVFPVPKKPEKVRATKPVAAISPWKAALPLAAARGRRHVRRADGTRYSYSTWQIYGDQGREWRQAGFDIREGDEVPAGCIVARFKTTGNSSRTVILRSDP